MHGTYTVKTTTKLDTNKTQSGTDNYVELRI